MYVFVAMKKLTKAMCWEVITIKKDRVNKVAIAVYKKTESNKCYEKRSENEPALCPDSDDDNAAWYLLFSLIEKLVKNVCIVRFIC